MGEVNKSQTTDKVVLGRFHGAQPLLMPRVGERARLGGCRDRESGVRRCAVVASGGENELPNGLGGRAEPIAELRIQAWLRSEG